MVLRTLASPLSLVLMALSLAPGIAAAQSMGSTGYFSVSVSPQYPSPNSRVTITPTSGSVDLTNAIMTVMIDKAQIYKGAAQPLAVTLGASGIATTIKITMTTNGTPYTQTLSIRPQDVVIVAEPIASAPVLYAGKPQVPLDGTVRIVAVANLKNAAGKTIDPSTLSYSWTVDTTRIASASGIGRDTIIVESPLQYRTRDVSVRVQSQDGAAVGGASLSLEPQEPIVRIYENDPLLGILFDHTVTDSYTISGAEKSLYGAAYSFPISKGAPVLQWFLNGTQAQTGPLITLRPTGSGQGSASLSLVASAGDFTSATKDLSLSFGAAATGGSFFGL